jgi:hypothetical protein
MAKPREDFDKSAKSPAVDQVMAILMDGQGDDVPKALVAQAMKEGLTRRFSFYISEVSEDIGDDVNYIAVIYPGKLDGTFKSPYSCIQPAIPEAKPVDGCVETEWHFPKAIDTPAGIAKLLASRGFVWDKKSQGPSNSKISREISSALSAEAPGATKAKRRKNSL